MNNSTIRKGLILLTCLLATLSVSARNTGDLTLKYDSPAEKWTEAIPVGNGRLGAMVFGGLGKTVASQKFEMAGRTWYKASIGTSKGKVYKIKPSARLLTAEN